MKLAMAAARCTDGAARVWCVSLRMAEMEGRVMEGGRGHPCGTSRCSFFCLGGDDAGFGRVASLADQVLGLDIGFQWIPV